jgi:predicted RecB family nuclease
MFAARNDCRRGEAGRRGERAAEKFTHRTSEVSPFMSTCRITTEVLIEYLRCKYKAYLILTGIVAESSPYEHWEHRNEECYAVAAHPVVVRDNSRLNAIESLTQEHLKQGFAFVIDSKVQQEHFAFSFDALQRVPGASQLGLFHYVPVLFSNRSSGESQKLRLCCDGFVLEQLQLLYPHTGILVSGDAYRFQTIDLTARRHKAQNVLNELTAYLRGETKPRLMLNDHCRVCRFQQRCRVEAQQLDDLSLLNRMSERDIQLYHRKGIFTISQLSYTFRIKKRGRRVKARGRPHSFPLQALAIREQSVFVASRPTVPERLTQVYVDMEGSPSGRFVYLIGLVIVENNITTYHSFWAETEDDEKRIIDEFLQCLSKLTDPHIFFYGRYESRIFRRIIRLGTNNSILTSATNILSLIYANVYFPTYSNELKEIGRYLGCRWTSHDAAGHNAILWRAKWDISRDPAMKECLITYNREDCVAAQTITQFLSALPCKANTPDTSAGEIRFIEQIKTDDSYHNFGQKQFTVADFAAVTQRSYFDYQRDKIYIRSNPAFKAIQRRKTRNRRNCNIRVNKTIDLWAIKCPFCGGRNISRDHTSFRAKDTLDLRISAGGIRRWVIHYRVPVHRCCDCDREFVPKTFRSKRRFGHGLISWTIDQHISNRISFENLERTMKDYFHLPIGLSKLHGFKSLAARYYSTTCSRLLRKLVNGVMIHADETKINLKKGSGYVWAFTNTEEVLYLYRPSREADFLHELLADFKGVLITDFFTGYDSLPCLQQKCLVHLIREMNDDLLRNPFDQELKEVATLFGELLRRIVTTIDRVGLKSRYLRKHKAGVKEFTDLLGGRTFESEPAVKYCKRIQKYHTKLFTFLDHDGVPWNNNNAEHAVKYFAKYRMLTNGRITETGLQDYLRLLGLHQTCRYKEIRFLSFLLSKGRDIDRFADGMEGRSN